MARRQYKPTPRPWTPGIGYDGEIRSVADIMACSPERQCALVQSVQRLLTSATEEVQRGAAQYQQAVEAAERKLIQDRKWLADLMANYADICTAVARTAAVALEAPMPEAASGMEARQGEDAQRLHAEHDSPVAEGETP